MYTDDSDQIISEKDKMNPRKKKKIFKKLLKTDNNESYDCTCVVSAFNDFYIDNFNYKYIQFSFII